LRLGHIIEDANLESLNKLEALSSAKQVKALERAEDFRGHDNVNWTETINGI
jgi:hypothetical protein